MPAPLVVVVIVDGLPLDLAQETIPELPFLGRRLAHMTSAVSCFPSTTGPAYFPFLAGCTPGRANVPGIRWFDRTRPTPSAFPHRGLRSYVGPDARRLATDTNAVTLFARHARPASSPVSTARSSSPPTMASPTRTRISTYAGWSFAIPFPDSQTTAAGKRFVIVVPARSSGWRTSTWPERTAGRNRRRSCAAGSSPPRSARSQASAASRSAARRRTRPSSGPATASATSGSTSPGSSSMGFDLRTKAEWPEHHASHGALHRDHTVVPVCSSAPLPDRALRTLDVFALTLELAGIPLDEYRESDPARLARDEWRPEVWR